ncbi:MAG: hypothetical protein RAP03_21105, partial [Candidatus Electryonea clarkiae]|nr:hypothetical protein [Candidatus Electryonea clarkiae]
MNRLSILVPVVCLLLSAQGIYSGEPVQMDLLNVMQQELDRSVSNLENAAEFPLYYLQYAVTDQRKLNIAVKNGGLEAPNSSVRRYLDVDLRLGSVELDNTHEIRGGNWRDNYSARRIVDFPLDADEDAIRAALWNETEYKFRKGLERYTKVLANRQVKVEEEDLSNDFSAAEPQQYSEDFEYAVVDTAHWQSILKKVGTYFSGYPFVIKSSASFAVTEETTFMVNSEGSRLKHSNRYIRFILNINGMAEDGMELSRYETWAAASMNNLPEEAEIMATAERLV